jgi:hypothetical protein
MAKVRESMDATGGRRPISADCEWSTAEYQFFGVEEFPSVEALRKHIATCRESGFSQHVDEVRFAGTPWEDED